MELTLIDLVEHAGSYTSVWESPLLGVLRCWHQRYGAKFTLYGYTRFGNCHIGEVPAKWRDELRQASAWLRWGWHSHSPATAGDSLSEPSMAGGLAASQADFCRAVERFASADALTDTLRLHYFSGSDELLTLIDNGRGHLALLCADSPLRQSYDLDASETMTLRSKGHIEARSRRYALTDHRVEASPWRAFLQPASLLRPRGSEAGVTALFTHEWAVYPRSARVDLGQLRRGNLLGVRLLHRGNLRRVIAAAASRGLPFTLSI